MTMTTTKTDLSSSERKRLLRLADLDSLSRTMERIQLILASDFEPPLRPILAKDNLGRTFYLLTAAAERLAEEIELSTY